MVARRRAPDPFDARPTAMSELVIREEKPHDREAVRLVHERAFGRTNEADLVEALHRERAAVVALVAESAVATGKRLLGLAPLAVLPAFQRQGMGDRLVREGLLRCAAAGFDGVVVLGDPEYYPRFGFARAHLFGLRSEYDVPPEAFMALALPRRSLSGISGLIRYHAAFASV
jgi:putative acetyltransferase